MHKLLVLSLCVMLFACGLDSGGGGSSGTRAGSGGGGLDGGGAIGGGGSGAFGGIGGAGIGGFGGFGAIGGTGGGGIGGVAGVVGGTGGFAAIGGVGGIVVDAGGPTDAGPRDSGTEQDAGSVEACGLPFDVGPCNAAFQVWAFVPELGACFPHTWGGCGGNANRFETQEECEAACRVGIDFPCPPNRVQVEICLQCGVVGGCMATAITCALVCSDSDQCASSAGGVGCFGDVCQVGGCI